jgi:DNA repair photolyase
MIREITARVLLSSSKHPDSWFGIKYTMNLYRGCQHQCIYCDSRSECYQIENFGDILVKANAIDLLRKELPRKRVKGTVGTGSMNDPYMPLEAERRLTAQALAVIAENRFPVHIITKSDLVLRDVEMLREIAKVYATVSVTITTVDDALSKKIEPGAPPSSRRFRAIETLVANGIQAGVTMMPILPFIEDDEENIAAIVARAHDAGAAYVLPGFGMTMRDRQRAYFFDQLDRLFPRLRPRYAQLYGDRYDCPDPNALRLQKVFGELCARYGMPMRIPLYKPEPPPQLPLL